MKPDEIRKLYDAGYAADYDATFLMSALNRSDADYEVELLSGFLESAGTWLDVACGTGYFMSRFPHVRSTGLDLSPAMLALARAANADSEFVEANYLDARPQWDGAFDLVSCMWYAYALVDTIPDVERLIDNLSAWTSAAGTCFVPLADPALITGYPLPFRLADGGNAGDITLTGITWSYSERDGTKVHRHLVTPHPDFMLASFERYFEDVSLIRYPPAFAGWAGRPAIVARSKRLRA